MPDRPGLVWPISGQPWGSSIVDPFGGKQARSAGTTVPLPSMNVGMDVSAPLGTLIVSPIAGTVVEVHEAQNAHDPNEYHGWGGTIVIQGADGQYHRLSHQTPGVFAMAGLKVGSQVVAGQPIGTVGVSGNSTGPHLDWEVYNASGPMANDRKYVDPVKLQGGQGSTTMATNQDQAVPQRDLTPLEQHLQGQLDDIQQNQIAPYQAQVDEAQALVKAYTDDKDIPDAQWFPAHNYPSVEAGRQAIADARALLEDVRLNRATGPSPNPVVVGLAKGKAALAAAQKALAAETGRADKEAGVAATSAATKAAQAAAAEAKANGLQVNGSVSGGIWSYDPKTGAITVISPPVSAASTAKEDQPVFHQPQGGGILITNADGSEGRWLIQPPDKTPGTLVDPSTGDVWQTDPKTGVPTTKLFSGAPKTQLVTNEGVITTVNTQTGEQVGQPLDVRSEAQKAAADLATLQAQTSAQREKLVQGLQDWVHEEGLSPDQRAQRTKDAIAQLTQFDQFHQSRAEALQQDQNQRLADAQAETNRRNQALEQQYNRSQSDTEAQNAQVNRQNVQQLAQSAGAEATRAEETYQKTNFPAAQAQPALAPIYDALKQGKYPTNLGGPTVFPQRDTPAQVGQRVFEAVMQRLSGVSPLAQQYAGQGPTTPATAGPGVPPAYNGAQASLAPQAAAAPLPPQAQAITPGSLPPPGQGLNPWRRQYPAAYAGQ